MSIYLIALIFLVIAAFYASVGFGGGSSYISHTSTHWASHRGDQDACAYLQYYSGLGCLYQLLSCGPNSWKKILPMVVLSVPFAFVGGTIQLQGSIYKILAGITLTIASILMLRPIAKGSTSSPNRYQFY